MSENLPEEVIPTEIQSAPASADLIIEEEEAAAPSIQPETVEIRTSAAAAPPAPLQSEGAAILEAWQRIVDLDAQVRAGFEQIREIASSCGEKDRLLFERVRETQEILGSVSDVLAGKDHEMTLAEIDDLLAEKIGLGDEPRDATDIQGVLLILQEKARAILDEMKSYFHRTRTTLVQVEAVRRQREGRLAILEKQLDEIAQTKEMAAGFQKQVLGEKRSLESEIDSVNASRQNLEAQISLLEERIQKAMEEKVSVEDQTREVDAAKDELQEQLQASRTELEETEGILENLRRTLAGLEEEREAVARELKTLHKEKDRIADDIQVIERSRQDQNRQISHLEEEIEKTHRQMDQTRQEIEEIRSSADTLTAERQAHEETTVSETQKMEELEAELALLIEERTSLEENLEQEKQVLQRKQEEWKRQTEQLVEKNENIQLVQSEIDRIGDEITQYKQQTEELLAGKASLERQMEAATATDDADKSVEIFEDELRRLTEERDDLQHALKELEAEIRSEEAQVKELLLQKEAESRNRQELDHHLKTAQEEVAELRKKLESARKVSVVVKGEKEKATVGLQQQQNEVEERVQAISRFSEERSALEEEIVRVDEESDIKVPGAALSSRDTVYEVVEEGTIGAPPMEKSEEMTPAQKKAQRLARVIVSDIILYNKEILKTAANQRNFFEILEQPIKRSEEYYREKVPREVQGDRDYLREEMEKLRLSLKP